MAVNAFGATMLDRIIIQTGQIPVVNMALRAVCLLTILLEQHEFAVRQIFSGMAFGRVADVAAIDDATLLKDRIVDRSHIGLVTGMTSGTGN